MSRKSLPKNKTVKLEVKVPEGVDNEQQIRLAGEALQV